MTGSVSEATADSFNLIPAVEFNQAYQDNLFYTPNNKTSSFITTLAPSLLMTHATETLESSVFAALKGIRYSSGDNFTGYSSIDQHFTGNLLYRFSPRLEYSVLADYTKASNPNIDLTQPVVVQSVSKAYLQHYGAQGTYRFSEKYSGVLGYDYYNNEYINPTFPSSGTGSNGGTPGLPGPPGGGGGGGGGGGEGGGGGNGGQPQTATVVLTNPNVSQHSPSLQLITVFDEKSKGNLVASYTFYDYQFSSVDNYSLTLGYTRSLDEKWNLHVAAGGRFTHAEFNEVQRTLQIIPSVVNSTNVQTIVISDKPLPRQTSDTWGWTGQLALSYNSQHSTSSLNFAQQVAPGSSNVTDQTTVALSTLYKFTSEFEGNLYASYQLNYATQGEFATNATDDYYVNLSGGCTYKISRNVGLTGTYLWQRFRSSGVPKTNNYASLGLKFSYPLFDVVSPPGALEGY